jgi:hypothetical protein
MANRVSAGIGLEPSTHVGVRNSLHQLADFRFQKLIRNDECFERVAHVTAARRDRLVGRRFKPIDIGLWIGRDALRHARFRVDWTTGNVLILFS